MHACTGSSSGAHPSEECASAMVARWEGGRRSVRGWGRLRHSTQQLWLLLLLLLRGWDRQEWPWVCVCVDGRAWLRASVRVRGGKRWGGGAQAGHAASRDARTLVMGALSLRVPGLAAACECCGAVRARSGNKAPSQSSLPACLPRAQARCVRACCALDCVDGPTTAKACPKRCASRQQGHF